MEKVNAIRIQRWFRRRHLDHPLRFCQNFRDVDCLTLEPIRNLTEHQVFFLTLSNGDVHACEAVPWMKYFITHGKLHPATRTPIEPHDVWSCYYACRRVLPYHSKVLETCRTLKIAATLIKRENVVKLVPVSPLYRINLYEITHIAPGKKKVEYNLSDSRPPNSLIVPTHYLVEVKCNKAVHNEDGRADVDIHIEVGF